MSDGEAGGEARKKRKSRWKRQQRRAKLARRERKQQAKIPYLRARRRAKNRRPRPPAPFIVGMTRSGTTLLRLMLDAHPELTIPPETHFIPDVIKAFNQGRDTPEEVAAAIAANRRFGDFAISEKRLLRELNRIQPLDKPGMAIRAFYDLYARSQGKPRWGDKTPGYATRMRRIHRVLGEVRFVHMIRDGRDVALSLERRGADLSTEQVARRWRHRINRTRRAAKDVPHYLEVHYEDLVSEPEATLQQICAFLELDYHPRMLTYHERAEGRLAEIDRPLEAEEEKRGLSAESRLEAHSLTSEPPRADRVGMWREQMEPEDVATFREHAGELLSELGYEDARAAQPGT